MNDLTAGSPHHEGVPAASTEGQRWWVTREYFRPVMFGGRTVDAIVWAVYPVVGTGARRRSTGGPTYFATRSRALEYAHAQVRRGRARGARPAARARWAESVAAR